MAVAGPLSFDYVGILSSTKASEVFNCQESRLSRCGRQCDRTAYIKLTIAGFPAPPYLIEFRFIDGRRWRQSVRLKTLIANRRTADEPRQRAGEQWPGDLLRWVVPHRFLSYIYLEMRAE